MEPHLHTSSSGIIYGGGLALGDGSKSEDNGEVGTVFISALVAFNHLLQSIDSYNNILYFMGPRASYAYSSQKDGVNWEKITANESNQAIYVGFGCVNQFNGDLYVARLESYMGSRLYKSTDQGLTFIDLQLGTDINNQNVKSCDFLNSTDGFFATGKYLYFYDGTSFTQIMSDDSSINGITPGEINAVAVDSAGRLYVGTQNSLFISDDNGSSYTHYSI